MNVWFFIGWVSAGCFFGLVQLFFWLLAREHKKGREEGREEVLRIKGFSNNTDK